MKIEDLTWYLLIILLIWSSLCVVGGPGKLNVTFEDQITVTNEVDPFGASVIVDYNLWFKFSDGSRKKMQLGKCFVGTKTFDDCTSAVKAKAEFLYGKPMEIDNSYYIFRNYYETAVIWYGYGLIMFIYLGIVFYIHRMQFLKQRILKQRKTT